MTEKDNASMTTVQMKADYAASEVYSTASEPPPAYKRQSNSVKIAKITAFTIIVSSFILGAFILASSYLQAKASCDQVQALDSVLEKELMLETLQQVNKELPRAEALLGHENDGDLQNLDKEEPAKKVEHRMIKAEHKSVEEEANTNENNDIENSEEAEEMQKYPGKLPLELDLSDLAAALLQNNKKSRMNCVVERKHAEEIVDSPSKTVALPFGMNLTTDPKKARITGERISIFCEGGNENKEQESTRNNNNRVEDEDEIEDVEAIRPMFIPFQREPISFGPIPNRFPLTHMPQRMEPMMPPRHQEQQHVFLREMPPPPPPFQQLPMRPPMPPQEMQAPHPEPQRIIHIKFQRIPISEMIHVANDVPQQISVQQHQQPAAIQQQQQQQQHQSQQTPATQQQAQIQQQPQHQQQQAPQQRQEFPSFQIHPVPLGLALQHAGITPEDLQNIQRLTENRINEEFRLLANESDEDENSNSSEDDDENDDNETPVAQHNNQQQQNKPQVQDHQHSEQQQQQQQQAERQPRMQGMPMVIQRIMQTLPEQPRDTMTPPMPDQPIQRLSMDPPGWGRRALKPVDIPVPMMEAQHDMSAQDHQSSSAHLAEESERPHFVQPRSV